MKNTNSRLVLSMLLSLAVFCFTNGQKRAIQERADRLIETSDLKTVKGTVTTFDKFHVKNAEVTSRKTGSKAYSDSLGMFDIKVTRGDILVFRADGFEKTRRKLSAGENEIIVDMILVPGEKYEKLAVDHGHLHEKDLPNIHKHHRIIHNDFSVYHDMRQLLQSSLLGTRVTDQGSIRVYVRGRDVGSSGSSVNCGAATFALDGMIVRDVDLLSPQDVRSIRLLTGHEATRLFGSQGANGVVWIRTR